MTIKQQGGIFGRNPTFNDVTVDGTLTSASVSFTALDDVPIGSSIPASGTFTDLAISQELEFQMSADAFGAGSSYAYILRTGSGGSAPFTQAGALVYQPRTSTTDGRSNHKFYTGSPLALALDLKPDQNAHFGGNAVFASGNGIDFSATSGTGTSELFSDYEEGNWTPAIEIYGTPGTYTATTSGIYTKVGNLVTVTGRLINVTESVAGGADYFKITGLPFTDIAGYSAVGSVSLGNWNVPACYNAFVTFDSTGARDYVIMGLNVDNGATDYLDKTHLVSGTSDIEFTISYFT